MAIPVTNEQNKAVLSLALSFRPWPLSFNTNSGDSSCREPTPASTAQAGQCRRAPHQSLPYSKVTAFFSDIESPCISHVCTELGTMGFS